MIRSYKRRTYLWKDWYRVWRKHNGNSSFVNRFWSWTRKHLWGVQQAQEQMEQSPRSSLIRQATRVKWTLSNFQGYIIQTNLPPVRLPRYYTTQPISFGFTVWYNTHSTANSSNANAGKVSKINVNIEAIVTNNTKFNPLLHSPKHEMQLEREAMLLGKLRISRKAVLCELIRITLR